VGVDPHRMPWAEWPKRCEEEPRAIGDLEADKGAETSGAEGIDIPLPRSPPMSKSTEGQALGSSGFG